MEKLQDIDIRYIHGIMEKLQENKYSEKEKVPLSKKHIIGEDGPFIAGEYGPGENGPKLIKLENNKEPFDPSKTKISLEMKQKLSNIKRPEGFENLKRVKKIRCEEENKNG